MQEEIQKNDDTAYNCTNRTKEIRCINRTKTHYTDTDRDIRSREKHKTHSGAGLPVKSGRTGIPAGAIGPKNHRIFYIQRERER